MRTLALALLLAAWCPINISAQAPAASPDVVAFVGATVVPMDRERLLENHTVIVSGGRITAVGPAASVRVPDGATRVDARGKFLMPGLSDMHGHLVPGEGAANDGPSQIMKLYLANGVTTVRGMIDTRRTSWFATRSRAARCRARVSMRRGRRSIRSSRPRPRKA